MTILLFWKIVTLSRYMHSLYDSCEFNIQFVHFKSCRLLLDLYNHYSTAGQNVSEDVLYWFQICFVLVSSRTCISILYLKSEYDYNFSHARLSKTLLYLWTCWLKSRGFQKNYTDKRTFRYWITKYNRSVVVHPLLFAAFGNKTTFSCFNVSLDFGGIMRKYHLKRCFPHGHLSLLCMILWYSLS